jgi:mono/diheme cytochrome c family protein
MVWGRASAGVLTAAAACLLAAVAVAQEHPATPHSHPDAQKIENPIASSPESIAAGGKVYAKLCANCHGATGRGNGRLAAGMAAYGVRPSDLVDKTWQHGSTDGEIFTVIRDGIGPDFHMDAFQKMIADEDIWHVVNYVRSLAIK